MTASFSVSDPYSKILLRSFIFSFFCDVVKMGDRVAYRDAFKVEYLAAAEYSWKDLMFFRGSKNENGIWRGFFKRFQESVESG